jgi:hypothetical protein
MARYFDWNYNSEENDYHLILNSKFKGIPIEISEEKYKECMKLSKLIDKDGEDSELSFQISRLKSFRYAYMGMYSDSILSCSTWIESLVFSIIFKILRVEHANDADFYEAQSNIETLPMPSAVSQYLPSRLGGDWDLQDESEFAGAWHKRCHLLHNRIVHSGYQATVTEADNCVSACNLFANELMSRVRSGPDRYSDLVNSFVTPIEFEEAKLPFEQD